MRVFVTGGTGHTGSYIIPELIAAGHEVTGLARSDTAAAAVSALGAKVHRGDLQDLEGLMEAAADSDGVIHVAHRQDLLPFGGMDAVSAAELPVMLAYGEALAGTGKPLVAAGSIGSSGKLGRPVTEEDPALPVGDEHKGTLRVRNVVETAVIDLAERGVRSSVVRIANIAHSTTDRAGFLPTLIALAKEKGAAGGQQLFIVVVPQPDGTGEAPREARARLATTGPRSTSRARTSRSPSTCRPARTAR